MVLLYVSVAAISGSAAQLVVQWDDNSRDETGYEIQRTTRGSAFVTLGTVRANVTSFVDRSVIPGTAYAYRVRAYNGIQSSAFSNVTEFTVPHDSEGATVANRAGRLVSPSKLSNLSARAVPGTGEKSLIMGFAVKEGAKSLLLRAIGPGIPGVSQTAVSSNPALTVQEIDSSTLANDNWDGSVRMTSAFDRLGAFPLARGSLDAALLARFSPGGKTVMVDGAGPGFAIAEIYDADTAEASPGRLVNLSVRAHAQNGDGVLIVGFVISGTAPMRVLLRASGPALCNLGVAGALVDPQLTLFRGSEQCGYNDNWGGNDGLNTAFAESGAFTWPDLESADAALMATLPPGGYTAIVSGVDGTTGVVLAEVYELP